MHTDNLCFLETTGPDEIPWHALTGPYGRGDAFPGWLTDLSGADAAAAERAAENIALNFEHQSTLWHATPFVMLCLHRMLSDAITSLPEDSGAKAVILRILDLQQIIYQNAAEMLELERPDPLPHLADLLAPDRLPQETTVDDAGCDDEDAVLEDYYNSIDESLFCSFFYYAWWILAQSMAVHFPALRQLGDREISEALSRFSDSQVDRFLMELSQSGTKGP